MGIGADALQERDVVTETELVSILLKIGQRLRGGAGSWDSFPAWESQKMPFDLWMYRYAAFRTAGTAIVVVERQLPPMSEPISKQSGDSVSLSALIVVRPAEPASITHTFGAWKICST